MGLEGALQGHSTSTLAYRRYKMVLQISREILKLRGSEIISGVRLGPTVTPFVAYTEASSSNATAQARQAVTLFHWGSSPCRDLAGAMAYTTLM